MWNARLSQMRLFQKAAAGTFLLFMGIMAFATYKAYERRSGSTGLDMTKVQKIRVDYHAKKIAEATHPESP